MAVSQVIWKDTYYTASTDAITYRLLAGDEEIFHGRAYRAPDEDDVRINISKVCQDYLDCDMSVTNLSSGTTLIPHPNAFKVFYLKNDDGYTLETYRFLYGWNYDKGDATPAPAIDLLVLSKPINGHYSKNQWRPLTTYTNSGTWTERQKTGSVQTQAYGNSGYTTEVCDGKMALIYCNALGGWDSFLFEGVCSREDGIVQHVINRSFNNNTTQYETERYISEIDSTWTCNTGWLSDEEAHEFAWNVVNSNKVYLHNLETDEIKPAIINETAVNYQTYEGNGKKLAQYKIKIKESQQKIRR